MVAPEYNLLFVKDEEGDRILAVFKPDKPGRAGIFAVYYFDDTTPNLRMPIKIIILGEPDKVWYVASTLQARIIIMTLFLTTQTDKDE